MTSARAIADAKWKSLQAEVLRGVALATIRRAEEIREELTATRAEIAQRRRWERQVRSARRPAAERR
jgi:hypothetical protein